MTKPKPSCANCVHATHFEQIDEIDVLRGMCRIFHFLIAKEDGLASNCNYYQWNGSTEEDQP